MPRPTATRMRASLRVAAVQMRFHDSIEGNLPTIQEAIQRSARRGADVVLFPECATTGYNVDFRTLDRRSLRASLQQVAATAAACRIHVLLGTPWPVGKALHNSLLHINREGRSVYRYDKCHLTRRDLETFRPGRHLALFEIDGIPATAIICHERRYPELVRLPVMAGARILFHPNAGLDSLTVSRKKRGGRDGITSRAFENAIPYVFANSVGPQGNGLWSAGDSKILGADASVLKLAGNARPELLIADVDLVQATGRYALEGAMTPKFLAPLWRQMIRKVKQESRRGRLTGGIARG